MKNGQTNYKASKQTHYIYTYLVALWFKVIEEGITYGEERTIGIVQSLAVRQRNNTEV